MDWKDSCRSRLREHLDPHGDLAPPWERFPHYERYTIGWRMGSGEDWLGLWSVFLEHMGYVDAFRLWGMSAFDDAHQLRRYLEATRAPSDWEAWAADQFPVD